MRTIKFRGLDKETDEWIYSDGFMKHKDGTTILIVEQRENDLVTSPIKSETLGQFTGLTDKNGKDIYEGDILRTETGKPMLIGWSEKFASFVLKRDGWAFSHWFGESCDAEYCEIIGNIHENPELL